MEFTKEDLKFLAGIIAKDNIPLYGITEENLNEELNKIDQIYGN